MATPTDPLFPLQWHFGLIGDIETIWDDYDGTGVHVGVYDTALEYDHPDLIDNYDPSLHFQDSSGTVYDPYPVGIPSNPLLDPYPESHATSVAGLIGAMQNNGLGGTGVAPGVTLTGVNLIDDIQYLGESITLEAIRWAANFDIMSNSWGQYPQYSAQQSLADPTSEIYRWNEAYAYVSATGRDGLGTVIVQAAGNGDPFFGFGVNANGDGLNGSRYTATIAATDQYGYAQLYSNWGTGILVAAPAGSVTTDRTGSAGYNGLADPDYTNAFGGTSAATPIVSGVVALMLEANPNLGWRDVHNILALSASQTGSAYGSASGTFPEASNWGANDADNWNGGGVSISLAYGYGMVDAYQAVRMAEAWSLFYDAPRTSANEVHVSASYDGAPTPIPDYTTVPGVLDLSLEVTENIEIETVMVTVDVTHQRSSDLILSLITPDGEVLPFMAAEGGDTLMDDGFVWTFEVTLMRESESAGTWMLRAEDSDGIYSSGTATGQINDFTLDFYGAPLTNDDVLHFTNDFLELAAVEAGRRTISDTNGGDDWVNLVAVAGDVEFDLRPGGTLSVAGAYWATVAAGTMLENVAAGDGNDTLTGTDQANEIHGGRGDDILMGLGGNDLLFGEAGDDRLVDGDGNDTYSGGEGTDELWVSGALAEYAFYDLSGLLQLSANGMDDLVDATVETVVFSDQFASFAELMSLASSGPGSEDFTLTLGTPETGFYGNNGTDIYDDDGIVTGAFGGLTQTVYLTFDAFDIEDGYHVELILNGTSLGYLSTGLDDGYQSYVYGIEAAAQLEDNTIVFRKEGPLAETWGVTNIEIDISGPPVTIDEMTSDTGLPGDFLTNDASPVFAGTAAPLSLVTLTLDGAGIGTVAAGITGLWSIDLTATDLAEGAHTLTASATDSGGTWTEASQVVTVDLTAPTVAVILDDTELAVGETALVTFAFSEAVMDFDLADVSAAYGALSGLSTADGGVTWTATFTPDDGVEVSDATISVTGPYADLAANAGVGGSSAPFTISTVPPLNYIYGTDGSDTRTGGAGPDVISGLPEGGGALGVGTIDVLTGAEGADVFVLGTTTAAFYDDGNTRSDGKGDYARITDFVSGTDAIAVYDGLDYVITPFKLAGVDGWAIVIDENGNGSADRKEELIAHVTGSAPVESDLIASTEEGGSTGDTTPPVVTVDSLTTTDTTPALSGTVDDPTATLTVEVAGVSYDATNNGDGTWTLADNTINELAPGTYDVTVTATDPAGNTGSDSSTNELIIETQSSGPTDGNDQIVGTSGDDVLSGVPEGSTLLGTGSVDTFEGLAGADQFVFGSNGQVYYDDGKNQTTGKSDLGRVLDFDVNEDSLYLVGSADDYAFESRKIAGVSGVAIIWDSDGDGIDSHDEIIGHLVGVQLDGNPLSVEYETIA